MSVVLLVLALDEIDGMKKIMPKVKTEYVDRVIIVDGGSTDGTIEESKKMGFEVIVQKKKGHGIGFQMGVNASKEDYIIMWGPDGNFEPEEIPKYAKLAKEGYYDQVIVSRFAKNSINEDAVGVKGKLIDYFGNKMFTFLTNVFFGGHLTDSLNGSRMISRKALDDINFNDEGNNFADVTQMTARSLKLRHKLCNIDGNEGVRVGGVRKMRPLHVGATLSWEIIKNFIFWKV